MSEWQPRTGRLLTVGERCVVVRDVDKWKQLGDKLWPLQEDASEKAGRSITTADMATVLLFASAHAETPDRPRALPTPKYTAPQIRGRMLESVFRLSYEKTSVSEGVPLLIETEHASGFAGGYDATGSGFFPTELGLAVVDTIIVPVK